MSSRTVSRTAPRSTPFKPRTKRERSPTGPLSNINTDTNTNTNNAPPAKSARVSVTTAPATKATPRNPNPTAKATPRNPNPTAKATPRNPNPKTKSVRRRTDQASKTSKSITPAAVRGVARSTSRPSTASRRQRSAKKMMMTPEDLMDIYQLYLAIVNQRHVILGSDISSSLTDEEVNKVFVDKMEIQLRGARNANKFSNFLKIMNYVCRVGRATSYLLDGVGSANTERVIENAYFIKNDKKIPLTYGSLKGILSRGPWLDMKAKLKSLRTRGARWLKIQSFVEFLNESTASASGGEVFTINPPFMKSFREKDFNVTFKSLIEAFKETNDFLLKLQNILKSNDFEHKQLRQLFKASNIPTNNSLKILELMRSRNRRYYPKNMVNATGIGPRHHVQPQSMLSHYLGSNEVKSSTYTGRPLSLPSVLYFADAMLLRKNGMTFSRSPSVGKHNFRGKGDKVIIRQEPALLMPPADLQNYFYEINRCNTAWRHGGIHCGLENAGHNKKGKHGQMKTNTITNTNSMIETMIEAYTLNKSAFDYSEMYTLLDKSKYEAIYFDSSGVPRKIENDGDENIDGNYFFQNFRYIFKEGSMEIDLLKLIAMSFKSNNTKKLDFKKTFALQTTRRNMSALLNRLYKNTAVKLVGSVEEVMKIVQNLNKTYSNSLDNQEIDNIRKLLNEGERNNSSASRKLINARATIWRELGLK